MSWQIIQSLLAKLTLSNLGEIFISMHYNFSKLSELLLDVSRSKYSLSICWHISTRFLCDLTMLANLVSGNGVVKILKRWPKTNASNSVGLKIQNKNYSFTKFGLSNLRKFFMYFGSKSTKNRHQITFLNIFFSGE